ncbi:methionine ABC transporter permease [Microbacterium sp. ZW T5_45]|uniref:methionine ABC transporter permease n=1 Tax=Microbacterium sp. ZW T5_45 TaxID=3378080 RepID=UPI0038533EC5
MTARTPWDLLWEATLETLYMTVATFVLSLILGTLLGLILFLTTPGSPSVERLRTEGQRRAVVVFHHILGTFVNIVRSLPFVVLIIAIIPLTRAIAGTTLGVNAALVPLVISIAPYFARVIDNALHEIDEGRLEAVEAMGVNTWQLIWKVLLPEARSGLIAGSTLVLISIVGNVALAGTVGAGGLGDFAIKYGYQRYDEVLMWITVLVITVIVQIVQIGGDIWLRRRTHKR